MQISQLDLVIIGLYFVVVVAIAVVTSRGIHGTSDFFLAGRSMRWPFIGASLFATNISAEQFVGQAGLAFVVGMAVANYQLAGVVAFIAMGALFLPIYMKLGLYTTPEFLEKRYGPESRRFFSLTTLVGMAFAGIPGALYAGGRVTEVLFGFDSIVPGVVGLALAAGSYAMLGGLRTVIVTDFIQCTLLGIFMWMVNDSEVVNRLVCSDEGLGLAFLEIHFLHAAFALFVTASLLSMGDRQLLPQPGRYVIY